MFWTPSPKLIELLELMAYKLLVQHLCPRLYWGGCLFLLDLQEFSVCSKQPMPWGRWTLEICLASCFISLEFCFAFLCSFYLWSAIFSMEVFHISSICHENKAWPVVTDKIISAKHPAQKRGAMPRGPNASAVLGNLCLQELGGRLASSRKVSRPRTKALRFSL